MLKKGFYATREDQYILQNLHCLREENARRQEMALLLQITTKGIHRKKEKISFQTELSI